MTNLRLVPSLAADTDPDGGVGTLRAEAPAAVLDHVHDHAANLPLEALDIDLTARGLLAETTVRQRFRNPRDTAIEATYVFPLPDRAAVVSFVARLGDRVVTGVLKERGEARADYDRAIVEGRRAAIVEEDRPEVFTCRVGNLGPGETAEITLGLVGSLPFEDGHVTVRVPLVVAPRYVPGQPLDGASVGSGWAPDTDATPDASRITPPVLLPGFPEPIDLRLRVAIDPNGFTLGPLESSLHAVLHAEDEHHRVEVQPGERVDRDFVLRYELAGAATEATASAALDADGEHGTIAVTVVPPTPDTETPPRDVVIVLDRSGSMSGWKMVAARRAAGRIVDSLRPVDRFAVIAFDHEHDAYLDGELVAATDRHRWRAGEWTGRLDARGGTEMLPAIQVGLAAVTRGRLDDPGTEQRERFLVLVTDGQVANEDQLLHAAAQDGAGTRIFTVGIDRAVNAGLLNRLAAATGGRCDLVESEDRLDDMLDALRRRLSPPVLADLTLHGVGIDGDSVAASTALDVHAGVPLVAYARFTGGEAPTVELRARRSDGSTWTETLRPGAGGPAVPTLWAKARLRRMEDDYAVRGGDPQTIVDLSLAHRVLCRFTAFVAESPDGPVGVEGPPDEVMQPVSYPSAWAGAHAGPETVQAFAPMSFIAAPPPAAGGADYLGLADVNHPTAGAPAFRESARDAAPRPVRQVRQAFWRTRPHDGTSDPDLARTCRELLAAIERDGLSARPTHVVEARALAARARRDGWPTLAAGLDELADALDAADEDAVAAVVARLVDVLDQGAVEPG